ncbi:MAG: protein phosphatase 2C domain-containing protein [Selenomonadaceae bacterium]|nr:protein phosphatase 2C domain-containing protein [Selenomonadaceae bacterium]
MAVDIVVPAILFLCMVALHILRLKELNPTVKMAGDKYEIGAAASFGTRTVQQDYFGVKNNQGVLLMLLADGIGANGEVAAKLSVDTFRDLFNDPNSINKPQYFFKRAANASHKRITNTLEERQGETSIAAVMVKGEELFYSLIGNCRVAVLRNGDLVPVSEGQTIDVLAQHRYNEGRISKQETLDLLSKHRLYNVLGQDSFKDIELVSAPLVLNQKDLIVLMSQGVFNTLRWVEIEEVLSRNSSPQTLAEEIIKLVNNSPMVDKDNASIIICRRK